jgi:ribonuclease BN (tRNA processing enzyme)
MGTRLLQADRKTGQKGRINEAMKLLFLGTAGYHPNETRQTVCAMLPEVGFVLDAGTGFFRVRPYMHTSELHIFLSHAHLDHVCGLTYLLDVLWEKPVERVTVYGLAEHLEAVTGALFDSALFPLPFAYETQPVTTDFTVGAARVQTQMLVHPGRSVGYRFTWPERSLAYVTDTIATRDYLDLLRGVDVLIHECNFTDAFRDLAQQTFHSHTTAVATLAREAAVGQLVLTHVNPLGERADPVGLDQARAVFPATVLAEDHLEIEF